jgi:hypothetical protein
LWDVRFHLWGFWLCLCRWRLPWPQIYQVIPVRSEKRLPSEVPAEDSERMRNFDWKRQGKMKISHILGCVSISKSPSVRQGDDLWAHHDAAVTFWGNIHIQLHTTSLIDPANHQRRIPHETEPEGWLRDTVVIGPRTAGGGNIILGVLFRTEKERKKTSGVA